MADVETGDDAGTETNAGGNRHPETVPWHRFAEVVEERKILKRAKAELETQLSQLKPVGEQVSTLAKERDELRAKYEAEAAKWQEEKSILSANVFEDPDEAIDLARTFYGKLPAEGKPATLAEYVKALTPETAPRALQSYLRKPVEVPAATDTKPAGKPPPKVDSPSKPPPSQPAISAEQIRAARLRAQQTGDTTELKALMEKVRSANAQTA